MSSGRTVIAALALVVIGGCGDGGEATSPVAMPAGCTRVPAPPPRQVRLSRPGSTLRGPATARVQTSCGPFEIALETARAPRTTASFSYLAKRGVYDDTLFHRIVPGFLVQGGDPTGRGTGGPGYFVDEPPPQDLSYTRGVVAMAKSPAEPPGRSGSQFYVVTAADAGLTPADALLGRVTSGFDVVQHIERLGTPSGRPKAAVVIRRITIRGG